MLNPVFPYLPDRIAQGANYQDIPGIFFPSSGGADISKYRGTPNGKKITQEQRKKLGYRKLYSAQNARLSALNKQERKIYDDPNKSASEKRLRIMHIRKQKNDITKRVIQISADVF